MRFGKRVNAVGDPSSAIRLDAAASLPPHRIAFERLSSTSSRYIPSHVRTLFFLRKRKSWAPANFDCWVETPTHAQALPIWAPWPMEMVGRTRQAAHHTQFRLTAIVSHTQAVARIISDTQRADAITH